MEPTSLRDSKPQLFVQDFESLADWTQSLIERDRRRTQHERSISDEMEFTTEWQVESSAEMAHSP